jgi:hypothetical protein
MREGFEAAKSAEEIEMRLGLADPEALNSDRLVDAIGERKIIGIAMCSLSKPVRPLISVNPPRGISDDHVIEIGRRLGQEVNAIALLEDVPGGWAAREESL